MYLQPSANVFTEGRKCQLEEKSLFKYIAVETLFCSKSHTVMQESKQSMQKSKYLGTCNSSEQTFSSLERSAESGRDMLKISMSSLSWPPLFLNAFC